MRIKIREVEFEILELIAEGGQGRVYKAAQLGVEGFEKIVAIKILLSELSEDRKTTDLFISEAKLVANLIHENIVQIYQLGKYDNSYFFVLEYVHGLSLHDFLRMHQVLKLDLPPNLAVFIISRIARGLAYAHSRRDSNGEPLEIVHCDVCPRNVMISGEGLAKLTDFGIAKARTMGESGNVAGKLPFISPEQARGEKVDFRSDIYSLGVMLFYMLTGEFTRDVLAEFNDLLAVACAGFVDWNAAEGHVDEEQMVILRRMLAADRRHRYQDTVQLAYDLEYHIYKHGYGPTIVTLGNYMRDKKIGVSDYGGGPRAASIPDSDKTVIMS